MSTFDADVIIVGYGPIGQTLAALLAQRGHRVAAYERYWELYRLPRAVYFDENTIRVWQGLGVVEELMDDLAPVSTYDWFGADGELILRMELPRPGLAAWEPGYLGFQPYVEAALDRTVRAMPAAAVHHGWNAEALEQAEDHVALTLRRMREPDAGALEPTDETVAVRARYVVGTDGANSFVRDAVGIAFEDQGFAEKWLVVDLRPRDIDAYAHLETPCQWCDPARPHMQARNGRSHRRFEFMLLPGERAEDFDDESRVWELLARWMAPADAVIVRQAVYEFRARLPQTMHSGRVAIAGDAAHTMPPFMGQGLNSGVRDAAALAWRLDLLLRGFGGGELLESYSEERRAQNEFIVNLSTEMGRVSCVLDGGAAAERDATLRSADVPPPSPDLPSLHGGALAAGAPLAGARWPQGRVRHRGREGRFDDVVGRGFVLLARQRPELPAEHARLLDRLGVVRIALEEIEDLDGRLTAWLEEHRVEAVLARPDHFVFGAAATLEELPPLLGAFAAHLSPRHEGALA